VNTNLPNKPRQRKQKEKNKYFQLVWASNQNAVKWLINPTSFFSHGKNRGLVQFVNALIGYGNVFNNIHPSQQTLSHKSDVSLRQGHRLAQKACDLGIAIKVRRFVKGTYKELTCTYYLHPAFYDVNFRKKLTELMPSCWYLPLTLLMAIYTTNTGSQTQCGVQDNLRDMYNNINYTTESENNTKTREEYIERRLFYQKNLGEYMKADPVLLDHFLSPPVKALRETLSLTPSGCIWLSSYPDAVLDASLIALKSSKVPIHKPYPWIVAFCNNLCAEKGIEVTFAYSHQIAEQTGIEIKFTPSVYTEGKRMRDPIKHSPFKEESGATLSAVGFDNMKKLINSGAMENAFHEAQQKRHPQQTGYASPSYYAQRSPRNVSYKPQRDTTSDNLKAARSWMEQETPEQESERLRVKQECVDQLMKTLTTMSVAPSSGLTDEQRRAKLKQRLGL
jgi:hypothetical protein